MNVHLTIRYIAWGEVRANPNILSIRPIPDRPWIDVVEVLKYPVVDGIIQVPGRERNMFANWTGIRPLPEQIPITILEGRTFRDDCKVEVINNEA